MVIFIKINEAADFFNKLVKECPKLSGRNFLIMIPEPTLPLISEGYEVIIRKNSKEIDKETDETIHALVMAHKLSIMEAQNTIAIYTPPQ